MVARAAACEAISAHTTRCRIGKARQRADAQQKRHRQRANAINADAAVAHDVEFLFARLAAAETVGGIGEPVLMQAAGRGKRRGDGERRGRPRRQAGPVRQRIDDGPDETDEKSGDRKRPGRFRDAAAGDRRRAQERQAGAKDDARP